VQERVPFRRAMGKESDVGARGSKDDKDDGGGAGADGRGKRV
jgi:hypothetical protein